LCPQVRVADIVQLNGNIRPRSRQWWQLFRMVSQWHVDVVIVERRSFSIVAAVELDDASHLRPERRRRDILLEEVLRQAGIPLLRSHDARKLLQMTGEWLNRGLTLSGTKTHVKQRFLPLTPLLMVSDVLWSPVLPA
ncbi:DUF2726 domain-containing protein, partial [Escherichia coli]